MKSYLVNLRDMNSNEIVLNITTDDDLVMTNKFGLLDCWLDVHAPSVNWEKIISVSEANIIMLKKRKNKNNNCRNIGKLSSDTSIMTKESKNKN